MPMTTEQMAEFRCLHALIQEADADVFTAELEEDKKPLFQAEESSPDRRLLAKTEHAVKLYFRRAARILRSSNPFLSTSEADRR